MPFPCRGFPHPARRPLARPPFGPSPHTAARPVAQCLPRPSVPTAHAPHTAAPLPLRSKSARSPRSPAEPPASTVVTTPSSAFGSGKRLRGVPRLRRRQCTAYRRRALRSPGHTWVAEGNATRTAAQSGGEGTGTRSSAQHGEGWLVGWLGSASAHACTSHLTDLRTGSAGHGVPAALPVVDEV